MAAWSAGVPAAGVKVCQALEKWELMQVVAYHRGGPAIVDFVDVRDIMGLLRSTCEADFAGCVEAAFTGKGDPL